MKYRKKPVVIDAVKLDLGNRESTRALLEKMGAMPGEFDMPVQSGRSCWWRQYPGGSFTLVISTLECEMEAMDGDYIIKEPFDKERGFYPCKPDIFEATYEKVNEDE